MYRLHEHNEKYVELRDSRRRFKSRGTERCI